MSLESQVFAALNVSGVTSIVSTRIYPDAVPLEKGLPCVQYARLATEFMHVLDGTLAASRGTFEVFSMASTRTAAETLCDAAQTACIAARIPITGRRHEYDPERDLYASVLTVDVWS